VIAKGGKFKQHTPKLATFQPGIYQFGLSLPTKKTNSIFAVRVAVVLA
jgi:hypothetical protein